MSKNELKVELIRVSQSMGAMHWNDIADRIMLDYMRDICNLIDKIIDKLPDEVETEANNGEASE